MSGHWRRQCTSNTDPHPRTVNKKTALAANPDRGFAIQPNITQRRARLLGQVTDAKVKFGLTGCWVDPKNGNILLRKSPNARPFVITNTFDIFKAIPEFQAT